MVTAKLATWQTLFERVQAHKQLLKHALTRHAAGECPYPGQLADDLVVLEREATRALGEAAEALEAHHATEAPLRLQPRLAPD